VRHQRGCLCNNDKDNNNVRNEKGVGASSSKRMKSAQKGNKRKRMIKGGGVDISDVDDNRRDNSGAI
jgi:hypothetical protein